MINFYGLAFIVAIMIPNIIFAVTHRDGFENNYKNKIVETLEQVGRFGCFIFEILQVPALCLGYFSSAGKTVYCAIGAGLVFFYCLFWVIFRKESSMRKAVLLSVLPSLLFAESGILTRNFPLIAMAAVFSVCHIKISVENAKFIKNKGEKE